jgi:hypothetical protein
LLENRLNANHNHFIIVENQKDFRENLEKSFKMENLTDFLYIVVEGDSNTLYSIYFALENKIPILLVSVRSIISLK